MQPNATQIYIRKLEHKLHNLTSQGPRIVGLLAALDKERAKNKDNMAYCIEQIVTSLKDYPNGDEDISVMKEVDRLVRRGKIEELLLLELQCENNWRVDGNLTVTRSEIRSRIKQIQAEGGKG